MGDKLKWLFNHVVQIVEELTILFFACVGLGVCGAVIYHVMGLLGCWG